jgi:hypothetical protein
MWRMAMPAITPPHYLASLYLSLSSLYSSKQPAYGQNSTPSSFSPLFYSTHKDHMLRHAFWHHVIKREMGERRWPRWLDDHTTLASTQTDAAKPWSMHACTPYLP